MVSPLLPLLLSSALLGNMDSPRSRLLDQDFGLGLRPDQLLLTRYGYSVPSLHNPMLDVYYRPWAELLRSELGERGVSNIKLDKDAFKVILDVQQFKPEEIEVKAVDNYIIVKAQHEEKKDEHGLIARQFVRKYLIPESVEADQITSTVSSDGVLTIQAPVKELPEDKNERKIKIEFTGKPALQQTEQKTEQKKQDEDEEVTITTEEATIEN